MSKKPSYDDLVSALQTAHVADEMKAEYYRQHDLGLPPSKGYGPKKLGFDTLSGVRRDAKEKRRRALSALGFKVSR